MGQVSSSRFVDYRDMSFQQKVEGNQEEREWDSERKDKKEKEEEHKRRKSKEKGNYFPCYFALVQSYFRNAMFVPRIVY